MIFTILIGFFSVIVQANVRGYDYNFVDNTIASNYYPSTPKYNNYYGILNSPQNINILRKLLQGEKVTVQVYYECLCPDCREFDSKQFKDTVRKLGPYLDIHTYPYGNAKTYEHNGQYEFVCQHGPEECYGNKLHACAIDLLNNSTLSVFYNACLMDQSQAGRGSDDKAVDVCSQSIGIPISSEAIKQCAKGRRGTQLLKMYGDESKKANFNSVPHILINGVQNDGDHFMRDVCSAFGNPPPPCRGFI